MGPEEQANIMMRSGRLDEAEAFLLDAMKTYPHDAGLAFEYAFIPQARGDYEGALRWLTEASERFPGHPGIANRLSETRMLISMRDGAATATIGSDANRELVMGFESLGDDCTFGFVQRAFGAEPLSLLRWAAIRPANLSRLLQAGIDPVGEDIAISDEYGQGHHIGREYYVIDRRFGVTFHTHVKIAPSTDAEKVMRSCQARIRFLRRKLREDIEADEKHFIYLDRDNSSDAVCAALHDAMRLIGARVRLLVVRGDAERAGSVVPQRDGLSFGYINPAAIRHDITERPQAAWLDLLRSVHGT